MTEKKGWIVVIEDDEAMRQLLSEFLTQEGYEVSQFPLATSALKFFGDSERLARGELDVVISDIQMPEMTGLEFVDSMKQSYPEIPVVLATAFGSVETAITAIRKGSYDYIVKPFKLAEVLLTLERAIEFRRLNRDNQMLRDQVRSTQGSGQIIGKSRAMKEVFDLVGRVAEATANILITGESGSGKEIVAKAIHYQGPRKSKPFMAINCTAIPENLLESELFGHAKGAFTGAIQRKKGLFEEAQGGTLFLDEIGDMDLVLQAKLLRVLQERKIRPVGDNQVINVDVRIIAATHKDLKAAIKEGRFREDLYYRLSVIPIVIPSLRHRREDIPLLVDFFLKKYASANHKKVNGLTRAAMNRLITMPWHGNVRELENAIERMVVLSDKPYIDVSDIPDSSSETVEDFFIRSTSDFPTLQELEKRYIQVVMEKTAGRKEKASQILGINRRTLYRKEREYGFVHGSEIH